MPYIYLWCVIFTVKAMYYSLSGCTLNVAKSMNLNSIMRKQQTSILGGESGLRQFPIGMIWD